MKVMSAIERCRTAALGGHVLACEDCAHSHIAYNSCRNRHCPKCQGAVARDWLAARQAELLTVPYFHVVFTVPKPIADIALACQLVQLELVAGPLDATRWPAVAAHVERMKKRPSFGPCIEICRKIVKQDPIDLDA